jgi:hypothetical protein
MDNILKIDSLLTETIIFNAQIIALLPKKLL